jgi:hypothetical protein
VLFSKLLKIRITMKKFRIVKHYVSGYEGLIEAETLEQAIEIYDGMDLDELKENYIGCAEGNTFENIEEEIKG